MKKSVFIVLRQGFAGLFLLVSVLYLSACQSASSPKAVSHEFWSAVQQRDMEKAKNLSTWESVDYLKYFNSERFHPERFELGEEMSGDAQANVMVTLYSSQPGKNGLKIPGQTDLVKTKYGWRVDVKKTLGSIAKHTVDNAFDQLNNLMRKGVQELDKALSESLNEIGKALEEGTNELKQELSRPIIPPPVLIEPIKPPSPPPSSQRQQI
jgi:hypothetical protein